MLRWALKNLFQERARLLVSVGGVAAALFLVLLMEGVFAGASDQEVAYIEQSDAEVWVMQRGVSNMHMANSILPASLEESISALPGVASATPILYANSPIQAEGRRWLSYIVGLRPGSERGGPWAMERGEANPGPGEVVLSDVLARKSRISLGDSVTILGRRFRVVGFSKETFSMANTVTFISSEDMERLLAAPGAASYFLVKARPGVSPAVLAEAVRRAVPGVNALTREQLAGSDRSLTRQMGVSLVQVMTLIGFAVGVLVIGLTVYTATVRRAREYAIAKALGAKSHQVLAAVALQTVAIAMLGLGAAVALAFLARPLLGALLPEVPLTYALETLFRLALASLSIAVVAALLPALRVARVEPAVVFRE